jgi:hypothetical protein
MGGRGMEGSLAVQVDRLKRSMQNRDKRRDNDRRQRAVSSLLVCQANCGVLVEGGVKKRVGLLMQRDSKQ